MIGVTEATGLWQLGNVGQQEVLARLQSNEARWPRQCGVMGVAVRRKW